MLPAATGSLTARACCACCLPAACTVMGRTHHPAALRQNTRPLHPRLQSIRPHPAHSPLGLQAQAWHTHSRVLVQACMQSSHRILAQLMLSVCRSRHSVPSLGSCFDLKAIQACSSTWLVVQTWLALPARAGARCSAAPRHGTGGVAAAAGHGSPDEECRRQDTDLRGLHHIVSPSNF